MRRECGELALELVQSAELALLDRLLEERGDEGPERRQQVDLRRVERERAAALVAREKAEAAALADERHDDEGADPEVAGELVGERALARGIVDEHRAARRERAPEGVEVRDGKGGRQRPRLRRGEAEAGERHERRRLRDVAHDADALEGEAVRNRLARALEHRARAELATRERAGERVKRLELDVRSAG